MKPLKTNKAKRYLFIGVILLMFLPAIQFYVPFAKVPELKGFIELKSASNFTTENWFAEDFQENWEAYFNQQFGFRNSLVRLNNQMDFNLFELTHANYVVIGKQHYLFEEGYINAYKGSDFVGFNSINKKIYKLKCIVDTLQKLNKKLLVVFAAGKASYFPEYIPDKYLFNKSPITNYLVYKKALNKWNIPFIDYQNWFNEIKQTSPYPLFPKCGIHWSKYAEVIVADSLIRFLKLKMNQRLADLVIDSIEISKNNLNEDYDIGDGMNLLNPIETYPLAYPKYHFVDTGLRNNKIMVVADSYYWGMYNGGLSSFGFNNGQFWFYNNQIYGEEYPNQIKVSDADILKQILKHDVVIIMNTETNLHRFGMRFIENVYDAFYNTDPNTSTVKKVRLSYFINRINESEDMMRRCQNNVVANNSTLEREVKKFAEYLLWEEENRIEKVD